MIRPIWVLLIIKFTGKSPIMKKFSLFLILCLGSMLALAQTATDFTASDCSGNSYNLFTELDAGKVVVITWTMPCGACVSGALTAYNVAQSYEANYPGRVKMYLCDDFGDTPCSAINSWGNSNGLARAIKFSDATIHMNDYGIAGMPKTVAIGPDHSVLFNQNNGVDPDSLQAAIEAGLSTTAIKDLHDIVSTASIYPNPADQTAVVTLELIKNAEIRIDICGLDGKKLTQAYYGNCLAGMNEIPVNVSQLRNGLYQIKIANGSRMIILQLLVSR